MGKQYRRSFGQYARSLLLRLRHSVVPALCVLPLLSSTDCSLSTYDLEYSHPNTPIIQICDKPRFLAADVKLWGYNRSSKRIVTDEDGGELRGFYGADVFFEYVEGAPRSSLEHAPPEWGLTCPAPVTFLDHESVFLPGEVLPLKERCRATGAQAVGRANPNLFAEPTRAQAPCDSHVQAIVRVCARPPGIGKDVDKWASTDAKDNLLTNSDKVFADAVAKAEIIFIFDPNASPESVYWFVKDPAELRCPGPPPMPYAQAEASGRLHLMAAATQMGALMNPATAPKKGDGKMTDTSSPDGKGPPLTFLEEVTRQMSIAGQLASGNTTGSLKDPNGSRSGMPGGQNVGAFSFPPLQAGVAIIQILTSVGLTPKKFIEKVGEFAAKGQRTVINEVNQTTIKLADELIEKHGQYVMAESLRDVQTVLPYSIAQKFTAGLEGKFQAHKIFEKRGFKEFGIKGVDDAPSIILTQERHTQISNALNAEWKAAEGGRPKDLTALWKIYKKVYKDDPHWLEAIKHYFPGQH